MSAESVLPVVIIGAGPAGVSAAWALRARGVPVTLLDAGTAAPRVPPAGKYLDLRVGDAEQWRWQLGESAGSLSASAGASPKMRVPGLQSIFRDFAEVNRIRPLSGFHVVGALAAGGLSNAWGCGVSRFDVAELGPLAAEREAMDASYARVAMRTGLSGAGPDALCGYFGVDAWAAPPIALDALHGRMWNRRERLAGSPVRLGRARVAVLNESRPGRQPCDLSGTCLWGCSRQATWSALQELPALVRDPGFALEPGFRVHRLSRADGGEWFVHGTRPDGEGCRVRASKVLLAAGTLATTRLVLDALPDPPTQVRLLSNPTAAFLALLPTMLGRPREPSFGLAQLSFTVDGVAGGAPAMGNLFSTGGLPLGEFLGHLPISRRAGLPLLRSLLPAASVGNVFLPGALSDHAAGLDADGGLWIRGGAQPELGEAFNHVHGTLSSAMRRLGAWVLPGSFVAGPWGGDLHYAGTVPIRERPEAHQCGLDGGVAGLPGVHVIDGANLPTLPAKAHTLTIMANADRIASTMPLRDA